MTDGRASKKAAITQAQAEWRAVQLSTEPANFDAAETAITALYASLGGPKPHFVRLPSPFAAELYVSLLGLAEENCISEALGSAATAAAYPRPSLSDSLMSKIVSLYKTQPDWDLYDWCLKGRADDVLVSIDAAVRYEIGTQLRQRPGRDLKQQIRSQLTKHLGREQSARARDALTSWPPPVGSGSWGATRFGTWEIYSGWFDTGKRIGARLPQEVEHQLDLLAEISRSVGWWYPYGSFCILTDRPCVLRLDVDDRLHATEGRAVQYRDGTGIYSWHGTPAPPAWFEGKPPTPSEALHWHNTEQRRIACDMLGWATVLRELDAQEIDRHPNPMIGTLVEVVLPHLGKRRFLRVMCGTGREFALRVPLHVHTTIEAQSLIQRIPPEMVERIEVRT